MVQPAILDRNHLARYTLGDAALEEEVLGLFIGQMPESVATLRNSASADDWMRAAHTIKGSARAVGAWQLAEIAQNAEGCAKRPERWAGLVDAIEAAIDDVRERISQDCGAGPAHGLAAVV